MDLRTLISVGVISLLVSFMAQAQNKPTVIADMVVDYVQPPSTLERAVQTADAIVVGRVGAERTYQPPINGAAPRLAYTVDVTDVLKSHAGLTLPTVTVYRMGGDIDEGTQIKKIVERGFPKFNSGHQYVMLLSWNRALDGFEVKFGPDGAYELAADGSVDSPGRSALAQSQKQKTATSFLGDLKRAAAIR